MTFLAEKIARKAAWFLLDKRFLPEGTRRALLRFLFRGRNEPIHKIRAAAWWEIYKPGATHEARVAAVNVIKQHRYSSEDGAA